MKATIDGITYEGTEEEIRRIVENPPHRPPVTITHTDPYYQDKDRWDVTPNTAISG